MNKEIKGLNIGIYFFLLVVIALLGSLFVSDHNEGFEKGRLQGWRESCNNYNSGVTTDDRGRYICEGFKQIVRDPADYSLEVYNES